MFVRGARWSRANEWRQVFELNLIRMGHMALLPVLQRFARIVQLAIRGIVRRAQPD